MQYTLYLLNRTWNGDKGYRRIERFVTTKTKEEVLQDTKEMFDDTNYHKDKPLYKITFHK